MFFLILQNISEIFFFPIPNQDEKWKSQRKRKIANREFKKNHYGSTKTFLEHFKTIISNNFNLNFFLLWIILTFKIKFILKFSFWKCQNGTFQQFQKVIFIFGKFIETGFFPMRNFGFAESFSVKNGLTEKFLINPILKKCLYRSIWVVSLI